MNCLRLNTQSGCSIMNFTTVKHVTFCTNEAQLNMISTYMGMTFFFFLTILAQQHKCQNTVIQSNLATLKLSKPTAE